MVGKEKKYVHNITPPAAAGGSSNSEASFLLYVAAELETLWDTIFFFSLWLFLLNFG